VSSVAIVSAVWCTSTSWRHDQLSAPYTLVISFAVILRDVRRHGSPENAAPRPNHHSVLLFMGAKGSSSDIVASTEAVVRLLK